MDRRERVVAEDELHVILVFLSDCLECGRGLRTARALEVSIFDDCYLGRFAPMGMVGDVAILATGALYLQWVDARQIDRLTLARQPHEPT